MEQISFYVDTLKSKIDKAIERIKCFENKALEYDSEGYYLAYSGGKDSDVILKLAELSKVKFKAYYNLTTVDPPELVKKIKNDKRITIVYPKMSMWDLIVKKRMPPTRLVRYCCQELKEHGGDGMLVITGVRWSESAKRKNNRSVIEINAMKSYVNRVNDNEKGRKLIENCKMRSKHVLNPIIDWTEKDVWDFIKLYNIDYCKLYDEGFKRLGCIGCPMAGKKGMVKEFSRYPKYKKIYIKTFQRMIDKRVYDGFETDWKTGEEVFNWWVYGDDKAKERQYLKMIYENQMSIFDLKSHI